MKQVAGGLCHKVFQIERHVVGHILKLFAGYPLLCQGEHILGQRLDAVKEAGIGMMQHLLALGGAVAEEVDGMLVEKLAIRMLVNDIRLYRSQFA